MAFCSRYPAFSGCEEADAVEQLLEAMNQGDETQAATILNSPLFKYLDNDFAKLARDLRENPPDGLFFSGGSSAKNSAAAAANESEEEYPEGLL
ncbi:NAPG [Bugula neritina]|uniref:NAPG n=1 Tax=Bugula neritina TaxID=10212 RepID=A0A7J7IX38_BUGNE|nr:NAPG [Bugula neritina]